MTTERIASGEVFIEVNDRDALARLGKLRREYHDTMAAIDREDATAVIKGDTDDLRKKVAAARKEMARLDGDEVTVELRGDLKKLRRDLDAAKRLVKRLEAQKAEVALTGDTKDLDVAIKKARAELKKLDSEKAEVEVVVKGADQAIADLRRVSDAEEKEVARREKATKRRLAAIEKLNDSEARLADQQIARVERRARVEARASERALRAKMREQADDERAEARRQKELADVPRLEAAYNRLIDKLDRLALAKRKARGDEKAVFTIELDERDVLSRLESIRKTVRDRTGHDPIVFKVEPRMSERAGMRLRSEFYRTQGMMLPFVAAVGAAIGGHMGESASKGFRRTMERGVLATIADIGKSAGRSASGAGLSVFNRVGNALQSLSSASIRLGPFTTSIRGAIIGLSILGPILLDLIGALGSLVSVAGAATLGIGALGVAFTGGAIPAAIGFGLVLKEVVSDFNDARKANKAYNDAVLKYGAGSDQAKKKLKELRHVMHGVSEETAKQYGLWQSVKQQWSKLSAPARRSVFTIIGESIRTANDLMPQFAKRTNEGMAVAERATIKWMKALRSGEGKSILDTMMRNFNQFLGPVLNGLGDIAGWLGKIGAVASGELPGIARTFEHWAKGINDSADDSQRLQDRVRALIQDAKDVGRFFLAAGRFVVAFFKGGVDAGDDFVNTMTNALNRWTAMLNTAQGRSDMQRFFRESVQGAQALYAALAPVVSSFVQWAAQIAPVARAFFRGTAYVSEFVAEILKLTGLSTPLAAIATTLGVVWGVGKISAATRAVQGFTAALLGMNRATAASRAVGAAGAAGGLAGGASYLGTLGGGAAAAGAARTAANVTRVGKAAGAARIGLSALGGAVIGVSSLAAGLGIVAVGAAAGIYAWANRTREWQKQTQSAIKSEQQFQALAAQIEPQYLGLADTALRAADAHHELTAAQKQYAREEKSLAQLREAGQKGTKTYTDLLEQHRQTMLRVRGAKLNDIDLTKQEKQQVDLLSKSIKGKISQAENEVKTSEKAAADLSKHMPLKYYAKLEANAKKAKMSVKDYIKSLDYTAARPGGRAAWPKKQLLEFTDVLDRVKQAHGRLSEAQATNAMRTVNLARGLHYLAPIADAAAKSFAQVTRLGGKGLATKIGLKYDDPRKAANVASSASKALQSGVKPAHVRFIVDNAKSAEEAIRRLNRIVVTPKRLKIMTSGGDEAVRMVERIAGKKIPAKDARIIERGGDAAIRKINAILGLHIPTKTASIRERGTDSVLTRMNKIANYVLGTRVVGVKADDHQARTTLASWSGVKMVGQRIVEILTKRKGNAAGIGPGGSTATETAGTRRAMDRAYDRVSRGTAGRSSTAQAQRGMKVTGPRAIWGEEPQFPEYVLSTNPAYRKSNLSYLRQAAQAMGIDMSARGKGSKSATDRQRQKARGQARLQLKKQTHPTTYASDNLIELSTVEKKKREEDNFREVIQREANQLDAREPSTFLKQVGTDPGTGDPLYDIDQGAIDAWAKSLEAMAARFDQLVQKIKDTAAAVTAAMHRIGDPYKDKNSSKSVIGRAQHNISAMNELIAKEEKVKKSKGASKAARQMADERIRVYRDGIGNEKESIRNATTDWRSLDEERNDIGNSKRGRMAEARDGAAQYRADAAGLNDRAASERDSNPSQVDPFFLNDAAIQRLTAESSLASIGQGLDGQVPRTQDQINSDISSNNQSIIDIAKGMLNDSDPYNDQSAYAAIQTAAGAIQSLTGATSGGSSTVAAMGQMASFGSSRADLYRSFAGNFAMASGIGAVGSASGGFAFAPPVGGTSGPQASGSTTSGGIVFNQTFQQMPDPHTWSQGVAFELQAAL